MNPEQLVIFDYSGTLSLASVLFGRPDNLMGRLKESGLFDLGVKSLDFFWREIVAPTWEEGSTTGIGYAGMIEKRLKERFPDSNRDDRETRSAANRFVQSYLDHSAPDNRWEPLLRHLAAQGNTAVVVATDHYAEATGAILRFLGELGLPSAGAPEALRDPGRQDRLVVANSADLGYPKGDRLFWETLKKGLHLEGVRRVLWIDDFGFNEDTGDIYGAREKVEARKERTAAVLKEVFPGEIRTLPFLVTRGEKGPGRPEDRETLYGALIGRTVQAVEAWAAEREDGGRVAS